MSNEILPPIDFEGDPETITLSYNSYIELLASLSHRIRECFQSRHGFAGNFWRGKTRQLIRAKRELQRRAV